MVNILKIGEEVFGQPEIAQEAVANAEDFGKTGDDFLTLAWETFQYLLEVEGLTRQAFNHAWPESGVVPFLLGKGVGIFDAEDISQAVALDAWKGFEEKRFLPWMSKWTTWILTIASRKHTNWVKGKYTVKGKMILADYADLRIAGSQGIVIADEFDLGWSIPVVADRWMRSDDEKRALFALAIMANYHNYDHIPVTSQRMVGITKSSKRTCHVMFKRFTEEVLELEGKS